MSDLIERLSISTRNLIANGIISRDKSSRIERLRIRECLGSAEACSREIQHEFFFIRNLYPSQKKLLKNKKLFRLHSNT